MFDSFTPRVRAAMIDMLRLREDFGNDADHRAHVELAEAIAQRDTATAAQRSRVHLTALGTALS